MRALLLAIPLALASGGAQAQDWALKQFCHHGADFNVTASATRKDGVARLAYFRIFSDAGAMLTDVNAKSTGKRPDSMRFLLPGGRRGAVTLGPDAQTVSLVMDGGKSETLTPDACAADRARFPAPAPF